MQKKDKAGCETFVCQKKQQLAEKTCVPIREKFSKQKFLCRNERKLAERGKLVCQTEIKFVDRTLCLIRFFGDKTCVPMRKKACNYVYRSSYDNKRKKLAEKSLCAKMRESLRRLIYVLK